MYVGGAEVRSERGWRVADSLAPGMHDWCV